MGGLCSGGEEAQTIKPIINPDNKVNNNISNAPPKEPRVKEEIDPNKIQYCRRCSTTYKEKDNTSESCVYHPGKFGRNTSSTTPWHSAEYTCCKNQDENSIGCKKGKHRRSK